MIDLKTFTRLKQQVEDLRQERDKGQGALDHLLHQLLEEFDCHNLKAAKKLLAKLEREASRAEQAFAEKLEAFEEEWGDVLAERSAKEGKRPHHQAPDGDN